MTFHLAHEVSEVLKAALGPAADLVSTREGSDLGGVR
jgi:hypothetical protein